MRNCLLVACVLGPASIAVAQRPNIVFIIADDLGWRDVGYQGSEINTPNIDRLAAGGMRFERYYTYPMCNPTRTALMTGRMPARMTGRRNSVPLDERLLPQVLLEEGYQTVAMGKWHLGSNHVDYFAHNRGFEHFYGHLSAGIDYFSHVANGALDWQRNGLSVREEGYSTTLLTDEAVRRIEHRDADRPLFLYVAYNAPHAPLQAPQEYIDRYAHIEDQRSRTYAAMVDAMDQGVGRIVDAIDAAGIRDNTLIVWVSDNGGSGIADNGALRGRKGSTYEGGVRVPGLVNWPGKIPAGATLAQQISVHDWLPTLTAAAEIEFLRVKPLDGQNMWPAIARGETIERKPLMILYQGNDAVYRDTWKLVRTPRTEPELFDIVADPFEQNNLAERHPELVFELAALVDPFTTSRNADDQASGDTAPEGRRGVRRGRGGRTPEQMLEQWDADEDGKLVADELPDDVRPLLMRRDTDEDGVLSGEELAAVGGRRGGARRTPEQMLEEWDADGDGRLVADELPDDRREVLMERDADQDGLLTGEELAAGAGTRARSGRRQSGSSASGPEETRPPLAEAADRD